MNSKTPVVGNHDEWWPEEEDTFFDLGWKDEDGEWNNTSIISEAVVLSVFFVCSSILMIVFEVQLS